MNDCLEIHANTEKLRGILLEAGACLVGFADLGWIGKSTLLVPADYGPRKRLGVMLTDVPLITNNPAVKSKCYDCNACVEACPVSALTGLNWSQGRDRSDLFDVKLCNNHLLEGIRTIGRKHICGMCLKACPIGRQ
jgi:epoxyqueuosine reductase